MQDPQQNQSNMADRNGLELHIQSPSAELMRTRRRPASRIRVGLLIWHNIVTILVIAYLAAFANYIRFKVTLYVKEYEELVRRPWLIVLLICEMVYFIGSLVAAIDLLLPPEICPKPDPPCLENHPTVHILLPCCKEPTDVPIDTIRAALALDYPPDKFKVLVLDDGGDDDLKAHCEALQAETAGQRVQYLRREKISGVPHNFKCGNLNYGLAHSDAEFVVMMDADMILHPSYLQILLPHIVYSPHVSFVQIPQSFYNLPAGDPLNDACIFGYDRVMVHRNNLNCAPCVGTGAIFRRKNLDEIGGFQPQSITEDTMTSYALFNAGFTSVYLNRKLQIGLTPWTFEGYIKQRRRWCLGAIQQFSATWKPMLGPSSKLGFVLKTCYFWHTGYYFLSIVNIVMVLIFLSSLAFHLRLTVGNSNDSRKLIICLATFLILWRLMWISVGLAFPNPSKVVTADESHFWWMTPYFFKTIMQSIFFYTSTFNFTPTSNIDRAATGHRANQHPFIKQLSTLKHVRVHIIYIILVVGLVGYRMFWIVKHGLKDCKDDFFVIAISFFLLSTCAHMLIPIMYVLFPTNFKPTQRKNLLHYKDDGVAQFSEGDYIPKWHWSLVCYETISYLMIAFWLTMLVAVTARIDLKLCKEGYI